MIITPFALKNYRKASIFAKVYYFLLFCLNIAFFLSRICLAVNQVRKKRKTTHLIDSLETIKNQRKSKATII